MHLYSSHRSFIKTLLSKNTCGCLKKQEGEHEMAFPLCTFHAEYKAQVLITQSCLTLCDPMDCSPPGSSVPGIFQARILEWVAIAFSKGSSPPRSPALQEDSLLTELQGKPQRDYMKHKVAINARFLWGGQQLSSEFWGNSS